MTAQNLSGTVFLDLDSIGVFEYHPKSDGEGKPTQVHLVMTVKGHETPLVMRFTGRHSLDQLVEALTSHADNVFGPRDN